MSKEIHDKMAANVSATQQQGSQQLSDSSARNDLNKKSPQTNGDSTSTRIANNASTPTTSPNNSPNKSSPSKSKSKKRNDAKRRSANIRKQQQQSQTTNSTESPSRSDKMKPEVELVDDSLEKHQQHKDNQQAARNSQTPSPTSKNNKQHQKQAHKQAHMGANNLEGDTSPQQQDHNDSVTPVSQANGEIDNPSPDNITNTNNDNSQQRSGLDTNSWRRKQRENRELREQLKLRDTQLQNLADRVKQQIDRTKELEASLVNTTRTCSQFEKLLQQELAARTKLEAENDCLTQTVNRLRNQISAHEKERSSNNELIRVLNATLMERETEVSILKLKMTRMQTNSATNMSQLNPVSNPSLLRHDPCKAYTMAGRSNSEFTRNSNARSTMMAEEISTRSSTSQLLQRSDDRDALVWANVPEELTPSKRPVLLERNLPQLYEQYHSVSVNQSPVRIQSSTPIVRDRRYRTLPRSMKNSIQQKDQDCDSNDTTCTKKLDIDESSRDGSIMKQSGHCLVTNLDESNNTSQSGGNKSSVGANSNHDSEIKSGSGEQTSGLPSVPLPEERQPQCTKPAMHSQNAAVPVGNQGNETSNQDLAKVNMMPHSSAQSESPGITLEMTKPPPNLGPKSPSTPVKISSGFKKIFGKFKRSDSSSNESQSRSDLRSVETPAAPTTTTFQRGATRSTLVGPPSFRTQMSPLKTANFPTDIPFADWDTNMLVDWLTAIGLSMYANQCRRWVECGAHIMNATPAEVDKGLGITNHLHRKKLRLAISELNGDCDKVTKAAAKLDYLWVARWLDDIGLPQYKEAFINARVDGRVLNYLTVEDLVSMGVKSLLHHSSIRCGIRVLRSINFDLQLLKRRATAEEIEQMNSIRESMDVQSDNSITPNKTLVNNQQAKLSDGSDVTLWTCHRVMEWLRMIDFSEFAPNLRGSGVHGGLIIYEDGFNVDTMSTLLSIPSSRTLLRRHLATFLENLIGKELAQRKQQYKLSSNQQLNPTSEIKNPKKSSMWFAKLKSSSKVGQDVTDEYLCPMYPVEPQIVKSPTRKSESTRREKSNLPRIPESINV
jgi:hypothetical protein